MRYLCTVDEIVDALGGTKEFAELIGRTQPDVSNWRAAGKFPATMHHYLSAVLTANGISAPPSLWRQALPRKTEAA